MWKLFGLTALLASSLVAPAHAQAVNTQDAVIRICAQVAEAEAAGDNGDSLRGQCVSATGSYLAALSTLPPGTEYDQAIADLAAALAELLFNPDCVIESEIAQAILLTQRASRDEIQQGQILLVYQTVLQCDFVITAAINAPAGLFGTLSPDSASAN